MGEKAIRQISKTVGVLLFVVFFSIKLTGETIAGGYSESKAKAEFDKEMIETSRQINRQLPMMVDQETRLDTTVVLNREFYYKYTLINYKGNDVDKSRLYEWAESALKASFCDNDNIKKVLRVGVKFNYIYYGKDGIQIIIVTLDSNKCR